MNIPVGATISNPVFLGESNYYCRYQARVQRAMRSFSETRGVTLSNADRTPDVADCPSSATLIGPGSSLTQPDEEEVIQSVSPPTLADVVPPKTRCLYRERYKETADVCG